MVVRHKIWLAASKERVPMTDNEEIKRLLESEEKYRKMYERANDAIFAIDTENGEILEANPKSEQMTGYVQKELVGMKVWDLHPSEEKETVKWLFKQVANTGSVIYNDLHFQKKDGALIVIDVSASVITYGDKRVIQRICRDVTDRKRTEEQINSQTQFRAVLDTVGEGIISIDSNSTIVMVNQEVQNIWGYQQEELIGNKMHNLMPEKYRGLHSAGMKRYLKTGVQKVLGQRLELEGLKKDGTTFPLEIRIAETKIGERLLFTAAVRDITERKRVKKMLEEHSRSLEDLAKFPSENSNPVLRTAKDGTILYANAASQPLLNEWGCETGQSVPDDWKQLIMDIYDSKLSKEIEIKLGDQILSVLLTPVIDTDYINAYGRDITERKRVEEELERSLSLLRATFDATADGILVVDTEGKMTSFNQKFVEIWHIPESIVESQDDDQALEFVLDQLKDPEGFLKKVMELYAHPDAESYDVLEFKDGRIFERYSLPQQIGGKSVGRVLSFRDVTERKQAEETLQHRIEFEDLITTISTRFINLASDEIDSGIKQAMQEIGEFAGVDLSYISLLSHDQTRLDNIHEWCTEGIESEIENQKGMRCCDFPWLMEKLDRFENIYIPRVADLPDEASAEKERLQSQDVKSVVTVPMVYGKSLVGMLGFCSLRAEKEWEEDIITLLKIVGAIFVNALERKRAEEELQRAYEELEQKVQERTRELREKQAQLVQTEKMATLGNLVAGVAHEINTPLGALKSNNDIFIRSFAKVKGILSDPKIPAEVREHPELTRLFESIEKLNAVNRTAAERIVAIVISLRKFARLDEAELDEVDIHEGLENTLTLVHHEIKNRIEVHRDYEDIPPIKCYPNQLNQVFMNLLVNASHAIEGVGEIFIKTHLRDGAVVIEIRDSGIGIPKEDLERIFDPGFTTKGFGIGTGLGLSIVYQIIEDHRGEIEVESQVGVGTVFRILLPVR